MLENVSVSTSYGTMKTPVPTVTEVRTSQVRAQMDDQAKLIEQLADEVRNNNRRIDGIRAQLADLTQRIEL